MQEPSDWISNSSLFRFHQTAHAEILRHKYYLSEKKGYDVGYDLAFTDWLIHYSEFYQAQTPPRLQPIT